MSNKYLVERCLNVNLYGTVFPSDLLNSVPKDEQYKIYFLLTSNNKKNTKLTIDYIGQACEYKTAQNRLLKGHEHYTQVLTDALKKRKSVFIMLVKIELCDCIAMSYLSTPKELEFNEQEESRLNSFMSEPHVLQQVINITEAALINYFKPKYNETFKNCEFPNKRHTSYKDYFNLEYNDLTITIPWRLYDVVLSGNAKQLKFPLCHIRYKIDKTQTSIFDILKIDE